MNTRKSPVAAAKTGKRTSNRKTADVVDDDAETETLQCQEVIEPRQPVLLGDKPRGMYECDYCRADLTRSPRVRCAICPDFDLCFDCLATSDHIEMCKSRREFQRMHRNAADAASGNKQEPASGRKKKKRGRAGRKKVVEEEEDDEEEDDDPKIDGYYFNNSWIPFFRHKASHGYVVADSTRYMLFPPFRGVRSEAVVTQVERGADGGGDEKIQTMDIDKPEKPADSSMTEDIDKTDKVPDESKQTESENAVIQTINEAAQPVSESADKITAHEEIIDDVAAGGTSSKATAPVESSSMDVKSTTEAEEEEANSNEADFDEKMVKEEQASTEDESKKFELKVIDDLRNVWTVEEDLRLLDGIQTCGLGNWPEIAEHINGGTSDMPAGGTVGGKTDKMCMERYLDDFLGRYGNILPPYTMVPIEGEDENETDSSDAECVGVSFPTSDRKRPRRSLPAPEEDTAPGFKKMKFRVVPTEEVEHAESVWPHPYMPDISGIKAGDEVARDLWYRSEQAFVRQCSNAISKLDADKIRKEFIEKRAQKLEGYEANVLPPRIEDFKGYPGSELAGYMPRRQDFDVEHDNDAELLISDLEFSAEDTNADRDLKVEVIKIFNSKLDERQRRKEFILEKKLTNYRENQEQFQKLPADERHLIHRMRLFERFHTFEEHQTFVDNILKAKRLRKEIAKLQTYRRLGITSLADAEKYEFDNSRREYHKMAWMKKEAERKKAEADAARQAKENASDVGGFDGEIGAAANQSLGIWKQYSHDSLSGARRRTSDGVESALESPTAAKESAAAAEATTTPSAPVNSLDAVNPADDNHMEVEVLAPDKDAFIIENKPGFDMLSPKERELCERLQLLPQHYLNVKKALISESLAAGIWENSASQKSRTFVTIDVSKTDEVIDFVLKAGWISSRPIIHPIVKEESKV
eukprot:scaffold81739_cov67-Cyclotella_meneghiniana.AAC.4